MASPAGASRWKAAVVVRRPEHRAFARSRPRPSRTSSTDPLGAASPSPPRRLEGARHCPPAERRAPPSRDRRPPTTPPPPRSLPPKRRDEGFPKAPSPHGPPRTSSRQRDGRRSVTPLVEDEPGVRQSSASPSPPGDPCCTSTSTPVDAYPASSGDVCHRRSSRSKPSSTPSSPSASTNLVRVPATLLAAISQPASRR